MRRMIKRMTAAAVASGLAVSLSMTALAEEIGPGFETPAAEIIDGPRFPGDTEYMNEEPGERLPGGRKQRPGRTDGRRIGSAGPGRTAGTRKSAGRTDSSGWTRRRPDLGAAGRGTGRPCGGAAFRGADRRAAFQFLTAGREQSSIRRAWCPIRC